MTSEEQDAKLYEYLMAEGGFNADEENSQRQMAMVEALRGTTDIGAQPVSTGRTFVAATPLGFLGSGLGSIAQSWQGARGAQQAMDASGKRNAMMERMWGGGGSKPSIPGI